jgi:hypothetical protein
VLTEQALSNFDKDKPRKQDNDVFETSSDISKTESQISYGNRVSQFGFTDMFGQKQAGSG